MNQLLRPCVLASAGIGFLLAACQPQAKPVAVAGPKPVAAVSELPKPEKVELLTAPIPDSLAMPLTKMAPPVADVPAFLAANNLAPLWQADFGQRENDSPRPTILDGFYGAEHRHISVIIDKAEQDSSQPNVFRVHGRTRYKKNITPFEGTITVQKVKSLRVFLDLDSVAQAQARAYTATARFVFHEDSTAAGAGTYQGTALLDFYRLAAKLAIVQTFPDNEIPAGGGGLLFRGHWRSHRTGQQQAVAFATYPQAILPNTMTDLYIGDRGENINPKYAGLDWNSIWENDEWWAKSPKPLLSL